MKPTAHAGIGEIAAGPIGTRTGGGQQPLRFVFAPPCLVGGRLLPHGGFETGSSPANGGAVHARAAH
ncbi:hypothetical protein LTV02_18575 [Nocardia yamanashiensis]|uniref:hypothetical protein n=1 Tax=Nocardia yamanashiensis TaxID=209247 RepID=UPI001E569398|nr:hypothetical protein [Nocardia yamanashiensis]UGT45265.1 hypothetical protein LTV02_18575 [Nocardia yamanashiensis]